MSWLRLEYSTLERISIARRIRSIILFRKTRFLGVFLSPRDFLKSLTIRLKEKVVLVPEEMEDMELFPPKLMS